MSDPCKPTLHDITKYLDAKREECKFIADCHYIDILIQQYKKEPDDEKKASILDKIQNISPKLLQNNNALSEISNNSLLQGSSGDICENIPQESQNRALYKINNKKPNVLYCKSSTPVLCGKETNSFKKLGPICRKEEQDCNYSNEVIASRNTSFTKPFYLTKNLDQEIKCENNDTFSINSQTTNSTQAQQYPKDPIYTIQKNLSEIYKKKIEKTNEAKKACNTITEINDLSDFKKYKHTYDYNITENSKQIYMLFKDEDGDTTIKPTQLNNILLHKIFILRYYSENVNKNGIYIGPLLDLHCLNMIKFIYKNSQSIELFHELENLYTSYENPIGKEITNEDLFRQVNTVTEINTLKLGITDNYTKNDYVMILAPKSSKTNPSEIENRIHKIHTYRIKKLPLERLIGLAFYEYWSIYKTDSSSLKKHKKFINIVLELLNQESISGEDIMNNKLKEELSVGNIQYIINFISIPITNQLKEDINNPLIYILLVLIISSYQDPQSQDLQKDKIIEKVKIIKNILKILIKKNKITTKFFSGAN